MKNNDIFANLEKLTQTSEVIFEEEDNNSLYTFELGKRTSNTAPLVVNGARGTQVNATKILLHIQNDVINKMDKVVVSSSRAATIGALAEFALKYLEDNDLVLTINNKKWLKG